MPFDGTISVVVCTRDRAHLLDRCLRRLAALQDHAFEVVVVDNSEGRTATAVFARMVGEDRRFSLVHEPQPGLSRARNRGLSEATGDVVAFTDDDVRVDPSWLEGVRVGFGRDPSIACVTGPVLPTEVDEVAALFEHKVSWSAVRGRERYSVASATHGGAFPYAAGRFGTGANFAVRAAVMRELRGFDEALGAGGPCRGGEDLDAFVRVLLAGHDIVYEPSAVVRHVHRSSRRELDRQVFAYGLGLSAYVTKLLVSPARRDVLRKVRDGAAVFLGNKQTERSAGLPPGLLLRELAGCVIGPVAYVRARRAVGANWDPIPELAS